MYKNEMQDEISDEELLHFMKEQFETVMFWRFGLFDRNMPCHFSQAIRAGYRGYRASEGRGEYGAFDEVKRWDYDLYLEMLKELCWR